MHVYLPYQGHNILSEYKLRACLCPSDSLKDFRRDIQRTNTGMAMSKKKIVNTN